MAGVRFFTVNLEEDSFTAPVDGLVTQGTAKSMQKGEEHRISNVLYDLETF